MKLLDFFKNNLLFVLSLFLLAFIPLYPKLPLIDLPNTWVYIRAEDFVVLFTLFIWSLFLFTKKVTLKTPLTLSIMLFWIIGAIATTHGVLLIFPDIANAFPNVALLSFVRRIEYLSVFFVAFTSIKEKKTLPLAIGTLTLTLILVCLYGLGQKYLGFPAYLTMNEEFAKGIPIQLSALSRVPSTFAGHYDLAAYLVLVIPIVISLLFGVKNWYVRMILLASTALGLIVLFMTVSRVSFFVLFVGVFIVFFFQKKRVILFSLPIVAVALFLLLSFVPALLNRFNSTVKDVDVLVDAKSGVEVGHIEFTKSSTFDDKVIRRRVYQGPHTINKSAFLHPDPQDASAAASLVKHEEIGDTVILVTEPNESTGETLPQGTGYINLSLAPVTRRVNQIFYEKPASYAASASADIFMYQGSFLLKKAAAYDLSFTTRYQGEWPHALAAFKHNILIGSGYGSISLAIDNDFLRILGETGLLGFLSFFGIFIVGGIYLWKIFPHIDSKLLKSFIIGYVGGVVGLILNAALIDVFEASKVAFVLWLLTGLVIGYAKLYQTNDINMMNQLKKIVASPFAIASYYLSIVVLIYSQMVDNFFVGDDFTWFRWISDCTDKMGQYMACPVNINTIANYFIHSDGFFYRPGTKLYFLLMYSAFWLNQTMYHIVSLVLHFSVAFLFYFLAKRILKSKLLAFLAGVCFLLLSGYSEAVFWISSTGYLFTTVFALSAMLLFIAYKEKKQIWYLVASLISMGLGMLFHEVGLVTPLFIILYQIYTTGKFTKYDAQRKDYWALFIPVVLYLVMRFFAHSHWFNGDYSYNLVKLPFNTVGNAFGYFLVVILGTKSIAITEILRNHAKTNLIIASVVVLALVGVSYLLYTFIFKKIAYEDKRVLLFGFAFFIIGLLPFLGLGNITSRYTYLASLGVIIVFVFSVTKLYEYLSSNGRSIALASTIVLVSVYGLFHLIQLQQIRSDWLTAGNRVQDFFIAIQASYEDSWSTEPIEFNFVNVPTRYGEAWVFPVGIEDALWLNLRNPHILVKKWSTLDEALNHVTNPLTQKIFEFDGSGNVVERKKIIFTTQ